ncbi:alpha/beta fold hydrolase [Bradyrhizobium sp. NP1]|uniref:alpha/beta fold hydrolase n=1 Tax=Bradyrhizobium sp. NP1 TaxID=3049772 RepID=UPI0025A54971|nr:alpha/beta fold hydrolase [Bradyrhizobium sp. NP1]WJR78219.1 alpha/beta fold hydrolase [Bradyrhizobium sp. NP1]
MHTQADPTTAAAPADSGIALHTFGRRDRPPLLLIHGIGMGHRLWLRQIDEFSATHFVIAPDLAGLTSPARDVPIDIALVAQSLAKALRSLGAVELSVCAISAGASVALGLALLGNVRIRRLMLSAPQARAPRIALGLQIAICAAIPESALVKAAVKAIGGGPDIAAAAAEDHRALGKRGLLGAMAAL